MARPKSEDKRNAIIDAAIAVSAESGVWSTPTAAISKAAGVAEGTLFTYFATKDALMNEIYRALKRELAEALLSKFPKNGSVRDKFRHIWDCYIQWGVGNPAKFKVMAELRISDKITEETKAVGYEPFAEIERIAKDCIKKKQIRNYPFPFIAAIMGSLAETTMAFVAQGGTSGKAYYAYGFDVFWRGIVNE